MKVLTIVLVLSTAAGCSLPDASESTKEPQAHVASRSTPRAEPPAAVQVQLDDAEQEALKRAQVEAAPEDPSFTDMNDNGIDDMIDIADGNSLDLDNNGIPDEVDATPSS